MNNRRLLEGEYHVVRGAKDGQQPAWSGYIEITGQSRDSLAEIFRWFDALPSGLFFAAENGGMLPVSQLQRERFDYDAGHARFNIVFAAVQRE